MSPVTAYPAGPVGSARRSAHPSLRVLVAMVVAVCVAWLGAGAAHGAPGEADVEVTAHVQDDGRLSVEQQITFPEGGAPETVTLTLPAATSLGDNRSTRYGYADLGATVDGEPVEATIEEGRGSTTLSAPGADAERVAFSYIVTGAVADQHDGRGTALWWPVVQGLDVPVREARATVHVPAFSYLRCTAGQPGGNDPCRTAMGGTHVAEQPTFQHGAMAPGDVLVAEIGFPAGTVAASAQVAEHWTFARAFSPALAQLGAALALLLLGAAVVWIVHRRVGGDPREDSIVDVASFVPVPPAREGEPTTHDFRVHHDLRPGLVGVLADERVDPIDITAELLDLAVRGHLRIEELPHPDPYAPADWRLVRTATTTPSEAAPGRGTELSAYEQTLLEAVAPAGAGHLVSELGEVVGERIERVQEQMYEEVVSRGWFDHSPDRTRSRWSTAARTSLGISLVAVVLLAALTSWGLVGVAMVLVSVLMVVLAEEMPARTVRGAALLAGLDRLHDKLRVEPTNRMPRGRELQELSEVLPYAVVLGSAQRWLDAVAARDLPSTESGLDWYRGPEGWTLRNAPDSLTNFVTSVTGLLSRR